MGDIGTEEPRLPRARAWALGEPDPHPGGGYLSIPAMGAVLAAEVDETTRQLGHAIGGLRAVAETGCLEAHGGDERECYEVGDERDGEQWTPEDWCAPCTARHALIRMRVRG